MEQSSPNNLRRFQIAVAAVLIVAVFGVLAAYQPTPMADRSNEPLSATAAKLAKLEGARMGAEDAKNNIPEPGATFEKVAADRANQTAFRGRKRDDWQHEFMTGYVDGWALERARQRKGSQ